MTAPATKMTHQQKIDAVLTMTEMMWEDGSLTAEAAGTDDRNWAEFEAGMREELRHMNAGQINGHCTGLKRDLGL